MVKLEFYRYISYHSEINQVLNQRKIKSTNPRGWGTWYTTMRFDEPLLAQQRLGLKESPTRRIGPILSQQMPPFDKVPLRPVAPAYGHPGGGLEACTRYELYIFGMYDYVGGNFEL